MNDLKELLAEKKRLATEQARLEKKISTAQKRQKEAVRKELEALAAKHGYGLADFLSARKTSAPAAAGARPAPRKRRQAGPPKYRHGRKGMDGRAARRSKAFAKVIVDGRIDDAKALKAGMINPAWLTSKLQTARAFVREHKVDVKSYK